MNGRQAKRLRKEAMAVTIGKPLCEYQPYHPPVYQEVRDPSTGIVVGHRKIQKGVPRRFVEDGSTRAIYKKLKKEKRRTS